ncbi:GNAT family N-acetyltransferase [Gordonia sp. TBRC 11910]|uniref:GNAT family N-acetyltransferase n=1 Tax=Gordonia asplenii TaxID=2725283 RepID=A0A848KRU5_9ACTN|nr:GNAT family N-acetyltransferase [Gordonia asplenii]NMO01140.1 GNAT family N-acetyltransferase [Gordonia asplenii]
MTSAHPLDDPITTALFGRQSDLAQVKGRVARYHPDVSVFYGHPRELADDDWHHLAALSAGSTVSMRDRRQPLPADWELLESFDLVQYSGENLDTTDSDGIGDVIELTAADVPEMTALVTLTRPGPFRPRTIEMGTYLGVRDDDGSLVAMAGERMRPDGWTEISGVCTAPSARGRGLASTLIRAVGAGIRAGGDQPFLHTTAGNPARKLYEALGFVLRSEVKLEILRTR